MIPQLVPRCVEFGVWGAAEALDKALAEPKPLLRGWACAYLPAGRTTALEHITERHMMLGLPVAETLFERISGAEAVTALGRVLAAQNNVWSAYRISRALLHRLPTWEGFLPGWFDRYDAPAQFQDAVLAAIIEEGPPGHDLIGRMRAAPEEAFHRLLGPWLAAHPDPQAALARVEGRLRDRGYLDINVLEQLAPYLSPQRLNALLDELREGYPGTYVRAVALCAPDRLAEAVGLLPEVKAGFPDESHGEARYRAVSWLAPALSPGLLDECLDVIQRDLPAPQQVACISLLMPHLPEARWPALLDDLLPIAIANRPIEMTTTGGWENGIMRVAPFLRDDHLQRTLDYLLDKHRHPVDLPPEISPRFTETARFGVRIAIGALQLNRAQIEHTLARIG